MTVEPPRVVLGLCERDVSIAVCCSHDVTIIGVDDASGLDRVGVFVAMALDAQVEHGEGRSLVAICERRPVVNQQ